MVLTVRRRVSMKLLLLLLTTCLHLASQSQNNVRPATDRRTYRHHIINHIGQKSTTRHKLNPHIAQKKNQKKEDSFLSYIQSFLNFFISPDKKQTAKPAAKRSSKKILRLVISKPKTKIPRKNVRIRRPPHQAAGSKNKSVFRNPNSHPASVKEKSTTDDSHQLVHKEEVRNLVVELHKTVHNILSQQNMRTPTNDVETPVSNVPVPVPKKSAINIRQAIPDASLSAGDQTLVDSSVIISPQASVDQTEPQVREDSSRFEPFVPNYLQLEDGGEGEIERSETSVKAELTGGPNTFDDCQELVSDCYEQLLDNKIIQLQGEMKRLERQYWGSKV